MKKMQIKNLSLDQTIKSLKEHVNSLSVSKVRRPDVVTVGRMIRIIDLINHLEIPELMNDPSNKN